jgi:hypothetical protein
VSEPTESEAKGGGIRKLDGDSRRKSQDLCVIAVRQRQRSDRLFICRVAERGALGLRLPGESPSTYLGLDGIQFEFDLYLDRLAYDYRSGWQNLLLEPCGVH